MKGTKLGEAMSDEDEIFENIFAEINVCPKHGDATFNEYDIFSIPSFDMQSCYDDSMPLPYVDIDESGFGRVSNLGSSDPTILEDDEFHCDEYESGFGRVSTLDNNYPTILEGVESYYNDKTGFGEAMTLFSNDSSIPEEVSIDYDENKVAIYDDYCDDMYAIKNNHNHEACHHDFNFQLDYASHDSYFVEFAPTIIDENKFAYVESNKISMLVDHERMIYVMVILLNSFMMLLKIIMREEHMLVGIAIISSFLSMC